MSIILYPAPSPSLVALSVVKWFLTIDDDDEQYDAVLQTFIDAAATEFEASCGQPIRATTDVYPFAARATALQGILRYRPCAGLTKVERYDGSGTWTELTLAQCRLHDTGAHYTIEYDGSLCRGTQYRITMTVGHTVIPKDIQTAIANHAILAYKDSPISGEAGDRIGLGSKLIQGGGGATGYTITFDKKDFYRNWNGAVERYRMLDSY